MWPSGRCLPADRSCLNSSPIQGGDGYPAWPAQPASILAPTLWSLGGLTSPTP